MSSNGKIEHVNGINEVMGAQYLNKELSDITLIVDSKHFHCHKVILASQSEHFKALLYGNFKEAHQSEIILNEISSLAFEFLIKYMYTGKMDLTCLQIEELFNIYQLVRQYELSNILVEAEVFDYLKGIVNISNVGLISERASFFQIEQLEIICSKYMDHNADEIIKSDTFVEFSMPLLKKTLSRDTFVAEETNIFLAIKNWMNHNRLDMDEMADVLQVVRLPLITCEDLLKVVRPSKLFPDSTILDALETRSNPDKRGEIKCRGNSSLEGLTIVLSLWLLI